MKQHTSILALALAGTLLVCSGCSQGEKIPASPVELTACSGERADGSQYTINLPEGWQVTQAGDVIIAQQEEDIPEQRQDAAPYTIPTPGRGPTASRSSLETLRCSRTKSTAVWHPNTSWSS